MGRRWGASVLDQELLRNLYRYGPISAQAVIRLSAGGEYGYKRLYWLKKFGMVDALTYAEKIGKRKKIKRAAIYYLTTQGTRFVLNSAGANGTPVNMRPRVELLETRYRLSKFLYHLCGFDADALMKLETARDLRVVHRFPHNVSVVFKIDNIAFHVPRYEQVLKIRTLRWLANCIHKLQLRGVARHHVLIAADTIHRQKLVSSLMRLPPVPNTHIILPEQVELIGQLDKLPDRLVERLSYVLKDIQLERNFLAIKEPGFIIRSASKSFYAADLSTYNSEQWRMAGYFSVDKATQRGINPFIFFAVQDENGIRDFSRFYPGLKQARFCVLARPLDQCFCSVENGAIQTADYARVRANA